MEPCHKPLPPDPPTATQYPSCTLGPELSDASYFFSGDTDPNMLADLAWIAADDGREGSSICLPENNNNQSLSSSSGEDPPQNSIASDTKQLEKPPSKSKKKQKRMKQPRFAFMTKSETDHLEDGYRWRKYGQKAVKNSPFPRSYYRCTNNKCTVKKRVERSSEDPTIVITTYEGQHCHHSAGIFHHRGGMISHEATFTSHQLSLGMSQFYYPIQLPAENTLISSVFQPRQAHDEAGRCSAVLPEPPTDDGLLGDIVPREMRNG